MELSLDIKFRDLLQTLVTESAFQSFRQSIPREIREKMKITDPHSVLGQEHRARVADILVEVTRQALRCGQDDIDAMIDQGEQYANALEAFGVSLQKLGDQIEVLAATAGRAYAAEHFPSEMPVNGN